MMRIDVISQTDAAVVLRVEGWVEDRAEVRVLEEEVAHWLEEGKRVVLTLERLQTLSVEGLRVVHGWRGKPVVLRQVPEYIESLITQFCTAQEPAGGGQP